MARPRTAPNRKNVSYELWIDGNKIYAVDNTQGWRDYKYIIFIRDKFANDLRLSANFEIYKRIKSIFPDEE